LHIESSAVQVLVAAVHAAVADEAKQVQSTIRTSRVLDGRQQRRIALKPTFADLAVDAGDLLVDDPAGADVEVADFRVAHEATRQPDILTTGFEAGARPVLTQVVPIALAPPD
jgi:hypothetical protein